MSFIISIQGSSFIICQPIITYYNSFPYQLSFPLHIPQSNHFQAPPPVNSFIPATSHLFPNEHSANGIPVSSFVNLKMASQIVCFEGQQFRVIDCQSKEAAYSEYNKMSGPRCVIHAHRLLQSFGAKKCVGYAVEKGLITFVSKDFRIIFVEDHKPRDIKDIVDQKEAIKKYENIPNDIPKILVKGNKILKKNGQNFEEYLAMAQLIYVNDEPKKVSFTIISPDKAKLISLVDMCKICTHKKASVIHENCSHLCYCKDCSKTKKDNTCAICGQESKMIEVNL